MIELSDHVKRAAHVIGWLDFEADDPHGRFEYVGQLLREEDGDEDDVVEDGLGCMTWLDGTNYAGEFRNGHLCGFGTPLCCALLILSSTHFTTFHFHTL
jgi:hypothetical protein